MVAGELLAEIANGLRGALLRREGLYSSNLTHWRQQMSKGVLKGLSPKKRGPKSDPLANENAALWINRPQPLLESGAEPLLGV